MNIYAETALGFVAGPFIDVHLAATQPDDEMPDGVLSTVSSLFAVAVRLLALTAIFVPLPMLAVALLCVALGTSAVCHLIDLLGQIVAARRARALP